MKKLQKVTGFIFGSIWWRFKLNVFAYLIASHVSLYIILISSIPFFTIKLNYMAKLIHNDFLNFFIFFMIKMQTCLRIIGQAGHVVLSGQAVCFLLNTIITISKVDGLILHPHTKIYTLGTHTLLNTFLSLITLTCIKMIGCRWMLVSPCDATTNLVPGTKMRETKNVQIGIVLLHIWLQGGW